MAIQVGGTTVINNSRELQNIASIDATTATTIGDSLPATLISFKVPSDIVIGTSLQQANAELIFRSNSFNSGSSGVTLSIGTFNPIQGTSTLGGGYLGTAILYNVIYDSTTYLWQTTSAALTSNTSTKYLEGLTSTAVRSFGPFEVPANKNYQWEVRGWNYTSAGIGGSYTVSSGSTGHINILSFDTGGTYGS
tara:strand:- start:424 stop:1002 length:579 start_codon:yes stop_codon:yes gene_type:complete